MKWIGQHIYDLVARFRNDVYLESISSGTIASGGYLGLDSNNKIVKSASEGDITDISLSAGTGIDLSAISGATGGSYEANIAVDVSDFMSNGISTRLLTASGLDTMQAETYLTFSNNSNVSSLSLLSDQDTGDKFVISTTTHGATTLTTVDDDATAAHFEIAADGNITLDAAGDIALECGGGNLTCDADTINFTSANADDPAIWIKNTANDNQATRMLFLKNRGADGQDGDECGAIYFYSYDDGTPSLQQYGYILSTIHDATSGEESGQLDIGVATHNGGVQPGVSMIGGSENEEVDVTIGNGANSQTTIAGDLRVTGDITSGLLMHYRFMGYGTGDGTNYFLGQPFTDAQAPFEHADSSSSDGLTIPASSGTNVSELMRSGGHVMPSAGTLKKWTGWATCNGTAATYIAIFKWTPADNNSSDIVPVLLDEVNITAAGNDKARSFAETSFTQASVAAGDIIFTQVKPASSKTVYFNSTLEVAF